MNEVTLVLCVIAGVAIGGALIELVLMGLLMAIDWAWERRPWRPKLAPPTLDQEPRWIPKPWAGANIVYDPRWEGREMEGNDINIDGGPIKGYRREWSDQ